MSKKILDYLHLYLGCEVLVAGDSSRATLGAVGVRKGEMVILRWGGVGEWSYADTEEIKPILRKLDSMTEAEDEEWRQIKFSNDFKLKPLYTDADYNAFHYLLSKHFDLFGLIEAGLASDAATI